MPNNRPRINPDYVKRLFEKNSRLSKDPNFTQPFRYRQAEKFRQELISLFGKDPYIYINIQKRIDQMPTQVYLANYLEGFLYLKNASLFLLDANGEYSIKASFCLKEELIRDIRYSLDCACVLWLYRFGALVKQDIGKSSCFGIFSPSIKATANEITFPLNLQSQSQNQGAIVSEQEIELIHKEMDLIGAKAMIPLIIPDCLLGFLSLGEAFGVQIPPSDNPEDEFSEDELLYLNLYALKLTRLLIYRAIEYALSG